MALPPHRVDYSPIIDRPMITWPNQARVAFWVAPTVEHDEYLPEYEGTRNPWPRMPYPDVQQYSSAITAIASASGAYSKCWMLTTSNAVSR